MNKVEAIAALVGSKNERYQGNKLSGNNAALARLTKVHPSRVTRWVAAGCIPIQHNDLLMGWAVENGIDKEMWQHLEHKCSCCGHVSVDWRAT